MKNYLKLIALLLTFAFTTANAQVITAERATEIANKFFAAGMQKSAAARGVVATTLATSFDSNDIAGTVSAEPTFHVLTNPEGGFVIVSGEETDNPVIGYSFDANLDAGEEMPAGFVDYLLDIDAQVTALRKYNAENPQKTPAARSAMQRTSYNVASVGNIVVNLGTATWGQGAPYNQLCFTSTGVQARTGCVPTAYAILCHYYKWPVSAVESTHAHRDGYGDPVTLGHTYDYADMLNSYSGTYTNAQATAVATLMRDLGYVYQAEYGSNSTPTNPENSTPLMTYFRYKSESPTGNSHGNGGVTNRSVLGNDTKWAQYIKECLDLSCPIPYSSTTDADAYGRHIFILDGYTDNGYYHFNWGWNGSGNGWFTLDNMVPDTESDYSNSHKAYFRLIPDAAQYTVTATAGEGGTVSINGIDAGCTANADFFADATATLTAYPAAGYSFGNWTKNGKEVGTTSTIQVKVGTSDNDYVANFLKPSATERVNVSVSYNSNYGTVTHNGSAVQGTGIAPFLNSEVTLVATPHAGYVFNGWIVTKGTNSTNYEDTELTFVAKEAISVEAKFSKAVTECAITISNISVSNNMPGSSSYCSTWTTTDGITLSAIKGTEKAYSLSVSNPVLYATANTESSTEKLVNGITYTLTAPAGYTILNYSIQGYSSSKSYSVDVTPEGASTITVNGNSATISVDVNAETANFVLNSSYTGRARLEFEVFTVTLQKYGAGEGSGSATTCTVITSANPAAAGTAKFSVGTGNQKTQGEVNQGEYITLYAVANTGYKFVNWTNDDAVVTTSSTYSFTVTTNTNLVANFTPETYTMSVGASEGGVAYIGTRGTTEATVTYNDKVIITAEANDGYKFVKWTDSEGNLYSTNASVETLVTTNVRYIAVFQSNQSGGETVLDLNGKYFRVKDNSTGKYMHIADNTNHADGTNGGVCVKAKSDNSQAQIFKFIGSGNDYKLQALTGYYISCAQWNVNAYSNDESNATLLTFEPTATGMQYLIKWNNTIDDDYFKSESVNGVNYAFCNAAFNAATTWTLEEVKYTVKAVADPVSAGTATVNDISEVSVSPKSMVTLKATVTDDAYMFVNWTLNGTEVVSEDATFTAAVTADATYTANFKAVEIVEPVVGTYYRIAYDFEVPVEPAAKVAAARAADAKYTVTPLNGGMNNSTYTKTSEWVSAETTPVTLRLIATTEKGDAIEGIQRYSDAVFKLMTSMDNSTTTIKYTLSVPEGYIISNYSFQYNQRYSNNITFEYNGNVVPVTNTSVYDLSVMPNERTAEFKLTSSTYNQNAYLLLKNFYVTVQTVGDAVETETRRFYVQSEACGVAGKENALLMTEVADASSIFYHSGNSLMSYKTGTFVKEDAGSHGLQAVGVENAGAVTIATVGENATIAAPYFMCANVVDEGENTIYIVDNCAENDIAHSNQHSFIVEEVISLPVTITSAGYATWYAPVAVVIPDGVKAYYPTKDGVNSTYISMTELEGEIIPAETGVILEGEAKTYYFDITDKEGAEPEGNLLAGTIAAAYISEGDYVLSNGSVGVGLYPVNANQASYSHKAYLPASALTSEAALSSGFRFVLPGTTAMENVEIRKEKNEIYDLTGRKLQSINGSGIYIMSGKKVIMR